MLVPEPIFVPRGRQFASTLVNGLLAGPSPELADTELNFLPAQLRSLSVPVSASGVAQVELTSDTATDDPMPATTEAELLVSQLAWTLRQDPTISRFSVTIGGRPVQLPNGETEFSVGHGVEHAPYVAGASTQLYGLRDGQDGRGQPAEPRRRSPGRSVRATTPALGRAGPAGRPGRRGVLGRHHAVAGAGSRRPTRRPRR